ncbi:hypothetical protein [Nonomuraea dietziae]|uniref:hypothetical protein n=1 Tax=Nonomuraea dietziae TaxID=65515 RepID=UPI0034049208
MKYMTTSIKRGPEQVAEQVVAIGERLPQRDHPLVRAARTAAVAGFIVPPAWTRAPLLRHGRTRPG